MTDSTAARCWRSTCSQPRTETYIPTAGIYGAAIPTSNQLWIRNMVRLEAPNQRVTDRDWADHRPGNKMATWRESRPRGCAVARHRIVIRLALFFQAS
jgi:NADH:ubiquinone oxidoreductase subunit